MLRGISGALAALALLLLSSCDWLNPDPKVEQGAREAYALFHAGNVEGLKKVATPELMADLTPETVAQIEALLPRADPASTRMVGYQHVHALSEGSATHALTYEYTWPDKVGLITVTLIEPQKGAGLFVQGFNINVATPEELSANDFGLFGKSPAHYLLLLGFALSVALMITAVVMSVRTPNLRRRWLWILASLAAVSQIGLNWTTGLVKFVLLHGALIGVAISKDDTQFAPWVLKVSIPIGAIIVIYRLWRRRPKPEDKAAQDIPPP